jgi:hypothetical protein
MPNETSLASLFFYNTHTHTLLMSCMFLSFIMKIFQPPRAQERNLAYRQRSVGGTFVLHSLAGRQTVLDVFTLRARRLMKLSSFEPSIRSHAYFTGSRLIIRSTYLLQFVCALGQASAFIIHPTLPANCSDKERWRIVLT